MITISVPSSSERAYAADVGLFFCCVLCIACRVKLFVSTNATGTTTVSSSRRELDEIPNGAYSLVSPVTTTNTNVAIEISRGIGATCNGSSSSNNNNNNSHDGVDPDEPAQRYCDEEAEHDISNDNNSFWPLPLTLPIVIVVNWFSVISNCLTYFLRPSQVLYALLVCSCDMMLYIVGGHVSASRNQNKRRGPLSSSVGKSRSLDPECLSRTMESGSPTRASAEGRESPRHESKIRESGWRCIDGTNSPTPVATVVVGVGSDDGRRDKVNIIVCRYVRAVSHGGTLLVFLNLIFVFGLLVLHVNHLMFGVGAFTGYLASCGTLYVLGSELGVLSLLVEWYSARGASRSPSTLLHDGIINMNLLPPSLVLFNRRLGIYYVLQHVFSFTCSVLYFSMLLDEGEALYSTHVEFMRWYVNTVGQGLMDIVQLLVLWNLTLLSGSRREK